jgi:hypothetical protein
VLISRAAVCTLTVPYGVMVTVAALGRWGYSDGADLDGANTAIPELLRIKPEINSFARFRSYRPWGNPAKASSLPWNAGARTPPVMSRARGAPRSSIAP